ncbi:ATP-binding cassette sub-family C member 4-like [Oculina patagonica]
MPNKNYEAIATGDEDDGKDSHHPTTSANFLSLLSFWWMNNVFKIESKRPLNQSDFLPLHEEDRTRDLTERLQKEWNDHVQECNVAAEAKQPKLWKCVLRMLYCAEILFLLSFWLVESVFRVSQPLVLGLLLQSLSSTQRNSTLEYLCCFLLSLSGLSTAFTHYSAYRLELIGMRLSSAIKGIVYLKIPLISQQSLRETTTGSVIDLISNDVQRIEQAPRWILISLFAVFEVVAAVHFLVYFIGWQPLMGVLFLMLLIPCVAIISAVCAELREKTAEVTDRRISLMDELVTGIRVLKAHAWEENYREKVRDVRRSEILILLKKNALLSIIESSLFTSRIVATFLSVLSLVLTGHVLSPSTGFMVLAFMNVLRITLCLRLGNAIPLAFELFVSFSRIESFLVLDNMPLDPVEYNQTSGRQYDMLKNSSIRTQLLVRKPLLKHEEAIQEGFPGICPDSVEKKVKQLEKLPVKSDKRVSVSGLTCKLNDNDEKYLLQDVSFEASEKSLTVITGQVGSAKSTLLAAIAGEAIQSSGKIVCSEQIGYVPQMPWVFSGTLRENVLFGEPYDEKKYAEVIEACALTEDIKRFPNGDLTFVGERGVVLSGGQRARLNLARAVYADADVYLLDDPLSAVDAKVSEHIFNQCICKLLRGKIIILATYAEKHMKAADQIVVLDKGSVQGRGSFQELREGSKILNLITDAYGTNSKDNLNVGRKDENKITYSCSNPVIENFDELLEISEEEKATGKISSALYWDYFRAGMHPVSLIAVVVLFLASQVVMVSPDVWLSHLTKKTLNFQQQETSLGVYASLFSAALVFGFIRAYLFFRVCLKSSENLHDKMVTCALQAPVAFFDTNPSGRILNRFSKDIGCIDELLPKSFLLTIQMVLFVFTAAVLPSFTSVWLCLVSLPAFIVFPYLTLYYLKTSRELKRWESICRSPVFSHFSETMAGLDTIRTRKRERDFIDQLYRHQDLHNQAFSMVAATTRWMAVRADVLCSLFITAVALVSVLLSQDPASAGLALSYVIEIANNSQYAMRQCAEVENFMTSVERVMAYTNLDSEPGYNTETLPPINWPRDGHVSFRNVVLRYYPGGPQVLKNLSFEIKGKTKLGIVGRTGDGKSSIVAALLRMPEAEGEISIDGVCISSIQLQESRRCISVLSQTPVLFCGTLRKNLDPLKKHRDDELWNVLEEVKLTSLIENLEGRLDYELLERGENLSVGERQLICLARTLLQQSKIVILDEPTANVDPNTEKTIWSTVHEKLKNSTVITIAHRLNTVKDCDVILVLKEGQVAELDAMNTLLAREGGVFYSMAVSQSFAF